MDKWIPPSPVVIAKKAWKVTGLTWASFPGNNSSPLFFLVLPVSQRSSECHGPPPPPNHQHQHPAALLPPPSTATYFSLHMLMLQSHSVGGFVAGGGRGLLALRGSCMHFAKLTPRWLPGLSLFYYLLLFLLYRSPFSPQTSDWMKQQEEELFIF